MRKITIFILLAFLLVLCAAPAYAQPALPHFFYGSVTINNSAAIDGSRVSATVVNGTVIPTQNPVATSGGNYGVDSPRLLVQGDGLNGAITFYVNGHEATPSEAANFEAGGGPDRIDLSVTIAAPSGGGGGGGAPADKTPPIIGGVGPCPVGVGETTADICWTTNEPSTSQVEYWKSPGTLSPLDQAMVTSHHVQLTELTPDTTYHYKTMSRDAAGNLAVSDEYTFATLEIEKPPPAPAAFSVSALSVQPAEVEPEEVVTITVSVANTGGTEGSYSVVLDINGVKEAEKSITVAAGESQEASFSVTREEAGSYSVAVDGLSGSFTVVAPAPPPPPPPVKPPVNWPLVGGIIAAVVIVGLVIFFVVISRRRAS